MGDPGFNVDLAKEAQWYEYKKYNSEGKVAYRNFSTETLKKMRDLDDKLIYALNVNIPTPSFRGEINPSENCKQLYLDIQKSYESREKAIRHCIDATSVRVNELKGKKDSSENFSLRKSLNSEQTKLRLLRLELNVEEVLKDRSLKLYTERCREHYKPPNKNLL